MMLDHLGYPAAHDAIVRAIEQVTAAGPRTPDMGRRSHTAEVGKARRPEALALDLAILVLRNLARPKAAPGVFVADNLPSEPSATRWCGRLRLKPLE